MALTDPFVLSLLFVFAAEMGDKTAAAVFIITGAARLIEATSKQALP